jgi:hypothetical protein
MTVNPSKRAVLPSRYVPPFGPIGAYAYIVGFTLPLQGNIPLLGLVLMGGCAAVLDARDSLRPSWTSLGVPVLGFLIATGLSLLVPEDVGRSIRLSAALTHLGCLASLFQPLLHSAPSAPLLLPTNFIAL